MGEKLLGGLDRLGLQACRCPPTQAVHAIERPASDPRAPEPSMARLKYR